MLNRALSNIASMLNGVLLNITSYAEWSVIILESSVLIGILIYIIFYAEYSTIQYKYLY